MALIGTMKYLTIGNQTYEIAGDELQIASASTLGGIKVGNGLSIDSTTGVLSTSITETDPVYSASAASGITSSDISNWNAKSDTDEKVKAIALPTTSATYYLVLGSNSGNAETKNYSNKLTFDYSSSQVILKVGDSTNGQKGRIYLYGSNAVGVTYLDTTATVSRAITLPDASGTIALTSDIPTVSYPVTSVNTKTGAVSLTASDVGAMSTSHAANAITATDISNWNAKADSDVNVTNTAVTAATTYYLTGSTSSSTATGGLSKHAAIKAYVTANSGTSGSARIDLGNTTATTSAGGKEGIIRLYGTSATYYVELKAGAPSANRTISFPNKAGTVALTDDIPTVSYPVTSVNNKTGAVSLSASDVGALASSTIYVSTITTTAGTHSAISNQSGAVSFNVPTKTSHLTNDSGFLTSYTETDPIFSASAAAGITSTDISNWNAKVSDDKTWNGVTLHNTSINGDNIYIPARASDSTTDAYNLLASCTPGTRTIALYDFNKYLNSTTPSANDNSTKVATTAYVDSAVGSIQTTSAQIIRW